MRACPGRLDDHAEIDQRMASRPDHGSRAATALRLAAPDARSIEMLVLTVTPVGHIAPDRSCTDDFDASIVEASAKSDVRANIG